MAQDLTFIEREGRRHITRRLDPLEAEPPYGYLLRLSDRHGQPSAMTFARELGMDFLAISPAECLVAVVASPLATEADKAALRRWTPDVRPTFSFVAGERVRRDDFSLSTRRYCPACLAESAHHRVWFDLLFMNICPFHGCEIIDRPHPSDPLTKWTSACIDVAVTGMKLAMAMPRLPILAESLEGYTLRRLGLAPARPDGLLDPFPLSDVVEASELVGRLVIGGWGRSMPLIGAPGFEAPLLRREGWAVMGAGREALKMLFGRVADSAPRSIFGVHYLFGWAKYNMYFKSALAHLLLDLMKEVATERGLNGRRYDRPEGAVAYGQRLTVREVADIVGESELAVVRVGEAWSLFEPHDGRKGTPLLATRDKIDRFRDLLAAAIKRGEACTYLGVPDHVFAEIVLAGHIPRYRVSWESKDRIEARRRAAGSGADAEGERNRAGGQEARYAIADLDAFLDRIPLREGAPVRPGKNWTTMMAPHVMTVPRMLKHTRVDAGAFFQAVFDGEIRVHARTSRAHGLQDFRIYFEDQPFAHPFVQRWLSVSWTRDQTTTEDAVSQREACAMLDLQPPTVKVLCDLGHLALVPSKDRSDRFKLDRASVEEFSRNWAAAKIYAKQLDCQDAKVGRRARDAGVKTFFEIKHPGVDLGRLNGIYDRETMRTAFGLREEPEDADVERRGWKRVAEQLGRDKSLFKLWSIKPNFRAMFCTADHLWPIDIAYVFGPEAALAPNVTLGPGETFDGRLVYAIEAIFAVGGKSAEARIDDFEEKLKRPLPGGLTASVDRGIGVLHATMRATIVVDDEGLDTGQLFSRYVIADLPLVLQMLYTIKGAFEDGVRTYDPDVFGLWYSVYCRFKRRPFDLEAAWTEIGRLSCR